MANAPSLREFHHGGIAQAPSRIAAAARRMAAHDWLLLGYLLALLVLTAPHRHENAYPLMLVLFDLAWLLAVLVPVRVLDLRSIAPSLAYRASLVALPVVFYLQLRWILPVIARESVDAHLLAFDLRVFGFEPALAWDDWVTPRTTEWFAFFYYSYFVLIALHAIPIALFAQDGRLLREFAFGILLLFCVGHLGYVVVPGLGPHVHIGAFRNPLEGDFFWPLVRGMVENAGAPGDIFPSLHTAVPLFLTLYAFRHRHRTPFQFTWPVMGFFSSQIIVATMFLRWHYLADIFAGILLAITAALLMRPIAAWEARRRARTPTSPTFARPLPLGDLGVWLKTRW